MKKVSEKQAKRIKNLAKIQPPKDGLCTRCHEMPDFRGLAKHHKLSRAQGGKDTNDNLEWLCAKCHNGPDGHRVEGMPPSKPVDKPCPLMGRYGPYSVEMQTGRKRKLEG